MNELVEKLFLISNEKYKKFNENIVKGNTPIIGVNIPTLRKIAQSIIKNNEVDKFFDEYKGVYFEEKLIKGVLITSNLDYFKYIDDYLYELDSWCLVDTFCKCCKFIVGNEDKYWDSVKKLIDYKEEFIIRTGYVLMLNYYLSDDYIEEVLELCLRNSDYYYVNMAIAWLISEIYIMYPNKVEVLLKKRLLNDFVQGKSIDKITDSLRVALSDKRRLRELK